MRSKEDLKNVHAGDFILSNSYHDKYLVVDYVTEYSAHCVTMDNYSSWLINYADIDQHIKKEDAPKGMVDGVDPRIYARIEENKEKITKINARKALWHDVCSEYLEEFCNRHGFTMTPYMWVHDDCGTMAEVCDMFVSMEDIRFDVDNDVDPEAFQHWYWKGLEICELTEGKVKYMNYESYVKGAPDPWTKDKMESLRNGHKRLEDAKKDLEDEIKRILSDAKDEEDKGGF